MPRGGLEPPQAKRSLVPETSVSTNSTTTASDIGSECYDFPVFLSITKYLAKLATL